MLEEMTDIAEQQPRVFLPPAMLSHPTLSGEHLLHSLPYPIYLPVASFPHHMQEQMRYANRHMYKVDEGPNAGMGAIVM